MAKKEMKDVKWTPELSKQRVKELGCKSRSELYRMDPGAYMAALRMGMLQELFGDTRSELQRMDGKTYKATLRMNKLFLEV